VRIEEGLYEKIVTEPDAGTKGADETRSTIAVQLCARLTDAQYVRERSRHRAYVRVPMDGVGALFAVRSRDMRAWLARAYYQAEGRVPPRASLEDAIATIEGMALYGNDTTDADVAVRVAGDDDTIDLDLGDDKWRMARVTRDGWRVCSHVEGARYFRRAPGMLTLPKPGCGGSLTALHDYLRVDDEGWALLASWLVAALRPQGPYPVLCLTGEAGAAKTTSARMLRALIDPSTVETTGSLREPRDAMIAADASHVIALDNLSRLDDEMSDVLCRLATGGGYRARALYTDGDEHIIAATRPVIVTSIGDVVRRGDLLDRTLAVRLHAIPGSERRTERALWAAFERDRPCILGGLLDAMCVAMRRHRETADAAKRLPRLADPYLYALAAEPMLGVPCGTVARAWTRTRADAHAVALEHSVAEAVRKLHGEQVEWSGTATELLCLLAADTYTNESTRRSRDWPSDATRLSGALRRLMPSLRTVGIEVEIGDRTGRDRRRIVHIRTCLIEDTDGVGVAASAASAAPAAQGKGRNGEVSGLSSADAERSATDAESGGGPRQRPQDRAQTDAADAADAELAYSRGPQNSLGAVL